MAETHKIVEELRKNLNEEKARQKNTVARLDAANKEATQAQRELATAKQALTSKQAELTEAAAIRETLVKEIAAVKAQSKIVAAQLDLTSREAARTKAELTVAQKALGAALPALAKAQTELAMHQKKLAETNNTVEELRMGLDAEKAQQKQTIARLDAASKEVTQTQRELATAKQALASKQIELTEAVTAREALAREMDGTKERSKIVTAQLDITSKEVTRTKTKLTEAQNLLAMQPPRAVTIVVTLPADAQLTFDGNLTTSTGARRLFLSPALNLGRPYYYTLRAEVRREGQVIAMEKQIEIRAGEQIEVSLPLPVTVGTGSTR